MTQPDARDVRRIEEALRTAGVPLVASPPHPIPTSPVR
jgi:hypothetical protein